MKRILFVLMLLYGINGQAMNSQDNSRTSIALEELVFVGKVITSCLICVQSCHNISPAQRMQSFVSSTAASCSSCASKCSIIPTCCCVQLACDDRDEDSYEPVYERSSGNYSPVFHPHHNIYNGSPRSLKD